MIYLDRAELDVLREAGRSEAGLQIFTMHRRLSLGPGQLAALVRSLAKRGYVKLSDDMDRISLTREGFEALSAVPATAVETTTSSGSEWIARPKLGLNFPYLPRRSNM